jgi:hypothetical protein
MAIQPSGIISLLDIQNEFGGSEPISLSEYYRGGALVPNFPPTINIPVSGTISFDDFYGAETTQTSTAITVDSAYFGETKLYTGYVDFNTTGVANLGSISNPYFGVSGTYYTKPIKAIQQGVPDGVISFSLSTTPLGNSGWTAINIGGTNINRTAFTYLSAVNEPSWQTSAGAYSENILYNKTSGTVVTVTFT